MPRSLIHRMISEAAFLESMKFCAVRNCLKADGAWIPTRIFLRDRARKSIGFAEHIRTCRTTSSSRSILMNGFLKLSIFVICCATSLLGADARIQSIWADADMTLDTEPNSEFWRAAQPVFMDGDTLGHHDP